MHVFEAWLHLFHPRRSNNHRPHLLHAESLFVLLVIAISFVGLLTAATHYWSNVTGNILGFATSITAQQVVDRTNAKRQEAGLAPLKNSPVLTAAAQLKAQDMFANHYWAHTSPQGKEPWDFIRAAGYSYQAAGENLARDFMGTDEMVSAWMNSPTHRANIVNARYEEVGIAVVDGNLDGTDTTLVVQMFGRPRVAAASVTPASTTKETERTSVVPVAQANVQTTPTTPVVTDQVEIAPPAPVEEPNNGILSAMSIITGSIRPWPVVSPLQLTKAFFFSLIVLIMATLAYDWALVQRSPKVRVVGKNLAHIFYLACILFLLVSFHSGIIR
jgi:uncharacterized protein YkwD